jgi:hypothetical protein
MANITKYVYKEKNGFYVDFEDYSTNTLHNQEIDDGDIVFWVYEEKKYRGIIRDCGNGSEGIYELHDVKERE